ncbi:FCD domain-containing protein [Rhodococcus sp. NPDC057014]|uniref:FCD domain-containing protein n=1 Tax=Rhodococcus sp. NPDC057014 TaxID=3346000 RepID=UPI003634F9F0
MSLKYALLGALTARSMNGYSLARFFAGAQNLIWSAPQSQVYGTLKRLESTGLVEVTRAQGANGLDTKVFSLTSEGEGALQEWVAGVHPTPPNRDAFALQALYFDSISAEDTCAVLEDYIESQKALLEQWEAHRDALLDLRTPLLRERLKGRTPDEHRRIGRLKAHVFEGQAAQAKVRIAWARKGISLSGKAGRLSTPDLPGRNYDFDTTANSTGPVSRSSEWTSRAEAVAQKLTERILSKQVEPGHRLGTKAELRTEYGVAGGTLNEAIRLLETRGLVYAKPGPRGGIFVASPPAHIRLSHLVLELGNEAMSVADKLEIRNALEVPVAVHAAHAASDEDVSQLRNQVEAMGRCGDAPAEYFRLNWDLHEAIAQLGSNHLLRTLYLSLLDGARDAVRDVVPDDQFRATWKTNWQLHVDLVEAIASRDPHLAARAAEAHTPTAETVSSRE